MMYKKRPPGLFFNPSLCAKIFSVTCGYSLVAERDLPKVKMRVRFPLPAPIGPKISGSPSRCSSGVEQHFRKVLVGGSNPLIGSKIKLRRLRYIGNKSGMIVSQKDLPDKGEVTDANKST